MTDLELIPTDDLVAELQARNDCTLISRVQIGTSEGDVSIINLPETFIGCLLTVHFAQNRVLEIIEAALRQQEDYEGPISQEAKDYYNREMAKILE